MKLYYRLALLLSIITVGANAQTVNGFNTDSVYLGKPNTSATVVRGSKFWLPNITTGLVSDNLLTIRNGRIFNIPSSNFVTSTDLNGYVKLNPLSPQSGSISVGLVESFGLNTRSAITFDNNTSGGTSQSILYKNSSGYDDLSYNPTSRLLNWVGDFRANKLDFSTIYLGNKAPNTLNSYRLTQGSGVTTSQLALALYDGTSYKLNFIVEPNRFYNMGVMQLAHSNVLTDTVSNLKIDRGNNLNPLGGEIEVTKVVTSIPSSSTRLQFNPDDTKGGKFLVKVPQSDGVIALTSDFATGKTIGANTTGNASTVTNGVYTSGSYANPSWITSLAYSKLTGTPTIPTNNNQLTNGAGYITESRIATGQTIGANTTGNAATATIATNSNKFVGYGYEGGVANPDFLMSFNNSTANIGVSNSTQVKNFLGTTLQDVTTAGNVTTASIFAGGFQLNGALGSSLRINNSGGGPRWGISTENTESSGDVGFDFKIDAYSNGNSYLYSPLKIKRSTGVVDFYQSISVASVSGSPALYTNSGASGTGFSLQWANVSMFVVNNSLTTTQTSASLNALYAGVDVGYVVIAPNVGTGMEYRKVNNTGGGQWRAVASTTI